jgi:hypothetical protein
LISGEVYVYNYHVSDPANVVEGSLVSMLKKVDGHSELLEDKLADLIIHGTIVISSHMLMRWTDTKRVTPKMWRYVHKLFSEMLENAGEHRHGYKLYVGEGNDTYSFAMWDRGEGTGGAADPWWKPIESLEQSKKRTRGGSNDDAEAELQATDADPSPRHHGISLT